MALVANPVPFLADLSELFAEAAQSEAGIVLDGVLCGAFAEAAAEAGATVAALIELVEAHGLIERGRVPLAGTRSPAERRRLAACAVKLDPHGRVVRFPDAPAQALVITEGGSAA